MKRRMRRRKRNASRISPFSMTISTLISTFISTKLTLNSTINLNLTLFEPHPSPPSHSPRTLQCPLSSPHPLSPHSIPLVTFNFTSITFCYESKSPWPIPLAISVITSSISMTNISITKCYGSKSPWAISVSAPFTLVIPTSSCFTRWVVSGSG